MALNHRKHTLPVILTITALFMLGIPVMLSAAPPAGSSGNIAADSYGRALITRAIQVTPSKNGLATFDASHPAPATAVTAVTSSNPNADPMSTGKQLVAGVSPLSMGAAIIQQTENQ